MTVDAKLNNNFIFLFFDLPVTAAEVDYVCVCTSVCVYEFVCVCVFVRIHFSEASSIVMMVKNVFLVNLAAR